MRSEDSESETSDEQDRPADERLPLDRRDFLQVGLAGSALRPSLVDRYFEDSAVGADAGVEDADGSPEDTEAGVEGADGSGEDAGEVSESSPSARRDYFPAEADTVSVRGLAPDGGTALGAAVRESGGRFSVRRLADEYRVDHVPVSVRELTTPQVGGPAANPEETTWSNWIGDYTVENAKDFTLGGSDEAQRKRLIQLAVRKADEKFRAVGSGHSHSDAPVPEEFFSDLKAASGPLDQPWLRPADDKFWDDSSVDRDKLMRLQAGTILKRLNREILEGTGLALPNMGAWDGQTLAGAINTGTHGTGLELGSFADLVRSVELVAVPESRYEDDTPHVRMFRIEPSEGITDPEKFARDAGEHNTVLIQDDEIFHSVVIGYGSMGIAYAYTLELREHYWLREESEIKRLSEFDPVEYARSNRHFNINIDLIEPQITGTSDPRCLLRTQNFATKNGREPTERAHDLNFVENLKAAFLDSWQDLGNAALASQSFSAELEDLMNFNVLELVGLDPPFKKGRHETNWHIALRRYKEWNPSPKVIPEPPHDAITTEVGIPYTDVKPAIRDMVEYVKDSDRFLPAPASVRFVKPSKHYLSPEYERATAMVEFVVPLLPELQEEFDKVKIKRNNNPFDLGPVYFSPKKIFFQKLKKRNWKTGYLDHFLDISVAKEELRPLQEKLIQKYDGRPHFGKYNNVATSADEQYLKPGNMFPEYDKWVDAYRYFNHFGTFDGEFTENKVGDTQS